MDLYHTFSTIIDRYYVSKSRVVLAFSGGVDSRVMLDLLARYRNENNVRCLAVHVHHGLSENADDWLNQCQSWAEQANIEFVAERVQLSIEGKALKSVHERRVIKHLVVILMSTIYC